MYGLLVDVSDISNTEQMVGFIQYFDSEEAETLCKFLFAANVLEESDSANAETLEKVIEKKLKNNEIPISDMRGL